MVATAEAGDPMTTQTFAYTYGLSLQPDGSFLADLGGAPLTFSIDGGDDGVLSADEEFDFTLHIDLGGGQTVSETYQGVFVGSSAEGVTYSQADGVGGTVYYLLTNSPLSEGAVVSPSDADYDVVCFLAGTRIATPDGQAAIETLAPGDLVLTHDGRAVPVKWLFVQTIASRFADPLRVAPIRVRAGALGPNLPARDLMVSTDHALLVGGALVHAGALVNGSTITRQTDLPERFAYYHLELEDHALILAEGVAAETYVDNLGRRAFDNWREYEEQYGCDRAVAELDLARIKSARQLPTALRAFLEAQAAA